MPPLRGDPIKSASIYLTLNARSAPGTFHWGLILIDNKKTATFHHAINSSGGWTYENKSANLYHTMSLVTLLLIGTITGDMDDARAVLAHVPADGRPSRRTGDASTCRVWLKDTLVALGEHGVVQLPADIDRIESRAMVAGAEHFKEVETGDGPMVINHAFDQTKDRDD